jgi:hypothetical protein
MTMNPEQINFFPEQLVGRSLDLVQLRELEDTLEGNDRQKRNFKDFRARGIGRVERQQRERVTAAGEDLARRTGRISGETTDLQEQTEDIFDALGSGRMDATEGRKRLAKIANEHRGLHDQIAQLRADEQAAAALADMEAEVFEQSYLATTPALRRSLPVLTLAVLNQP